MFSANILREIFMPVRCVACGSRDTQTPLCPACFAAVRIHDVFFCGRCHARLPYGYKVCHPAFPYLLGAATEYSNPAAKNLIHALKFKRNRAAAKPLAEILIDYLTPLLVGRRDLTIIPVPLSKRRERERGFNQSALIARLVAQNMDMPIANNVLLRVGHRPPQSETESAKERAINVAGVFQTNPKFSLPKNILLIDDVTTSGATFREAALALKAAGARTIIAAAVTRA